MKYVLLPVAVILLNLFFQIGFLNLPLAVVIVLLLRWPTSQSILFGFFVLLVSDLFNVRLLGLSFLGFSISGMLLSFAYLKLFPHKLLYSVVVAFLSYVATLRVIDVLLQLVHTYA